MNVPELLFMALEIGKQQVKELDDKEKKLFKDAYASFKGWVSEVKFIALPSSDYGFEMMNWQNSGNIYNYFWARIFAHQHKGTAPSISITANDEGLWISLMWHKRKEANSTITIEDYNSIVQHLDIWTRKKSIEKGEFEIYIYDPEGGNPNSNHEVKNKVDVIDFLKNEETRKKMTKELAEATDAYYIIRRIFNQSQAMELDTKDFNLIKAINDINWLYRKVCGDNLIEEHGDLASTVMSWIQNIKTSISADKRFFHKPMVLIALLSRLDEEPDHENLFTYEELWSAFRDLVEKLGATVTEPQFCQPYVRLRNDEKPIAVWQTDLADPDFKDPKAELPAYVRKTIPHIQIHDDVWPVFQSNKGRQAIREAIKKKWDVKAVNITQIQQESSFLQHNEIIEIEGRSEMPFSMESAMEKLLVNIVSQGYVFEPWQIAAYIMAIKTKPFIILAGISGTGKSRLPQVIADLTGSNIKVLPVRPDWTDSSDLLGYNDLQGNFKPGSFLRFVRDANNQPKQQFFCLIDEMNIARVEYYFAEVLSCIENRKMINNHYVSPALLTQELTPNMSIWLDQGIPENYAIVGTVNMDESTHGFSRKVLDRAFTIEFSKVDLTTWQNGMTTDQEIEYWPNEAWKPRAIRLPDLLDVSGEEKLLIDEVVTTLIEINKILLPAQLQVGYRTRDELALFVLHSQEILESFRTTAGEQVNVLDVGLQMKILPRIVGSGSVVRQVLLNLLGWSYHKNPLTEDKADEIYKTWSDVGRPLFLPGAAYPGMTARLCLMWERLVNEGYTSFWL